MTMSNSRRAASRHSLSNAGRLSRPLAESCALASPMVEGRERYTVSIRYPRDYRSDPQAIATEVLIPLLNGGTVPLGQVAKVSLAQGPASFRTCMRSPCTARSC
jgi:Cu/Ag efflux pump CusA